MPGVNGRGRSRAAAGRRAAGVIGALILLLALTPAARAQEPIFGICAFPITHEFPKAHASGREIPGAGSPWEFIETGQVFVRVTNILNGKSVLLNASSTVHYSDGGDIAYSRGPSVAFFSTPRGEIPAGVWAITGTWTLLLDDQGRVLSATGGVILRDICAELA
jgi:hypothetical protein